jgi:hypothetical protein
MRERRVWIGSRYVTGGINMVCSDPQIPPRSLARTRLVSRTRPALIGCLPGSPWSPDSKYFFASPDHFFFRLQTTDLAPRLADGRESPVSGQSPDQNLHSLN